MVAAGILLARKRADQAMAIDLGVRERIRSQVENTASNKENTTVKLMEIKKWKFSLNCLSAAPLNGHEAAGVERTTNGWEKANNKTYCALEGMFSSIWTTHGRVQDDVKMLTRGPQIRCGSSGSSKNVRMTSKMDQG